MVEPPTGTVILLFSDIEGSTRLLERAGDAYLELLAPGRHEVVWDGKDAAGNPLPSGRYVCRLRAEGSKASSTMVLVR